MSFMFGEDQKKLYGELRQEINVVAKFDEKTNTFPDPVTLNSIDRRILIKSIFSFIEASSNSMKANAFTSNGAWRLSKGERMVAEEQQSYTLNEKGEAVGVSPKLKTLHNVRFAFKVFAKTMKVDFNLDASGEGWQKLRSSLKVRDRLMHPKALSDVIVTDDEVRDAMKALIWFSEQERLILIAVVYSLESQVKNAEDLVIHDPESDDED